MNQDDQTLSTTGNDDLTAFLKAFDGMLALSTEMEALRAELESKIFALDAMLTATGTSQPDIDALMAEVARLEAKLDASSAAQSALIAPFDPPPMRGNF